MAYYKTWAHPGVLLLVFIIMYFVMLFAVGAIVWVATAP